jgi:small subunit ribosomal protein S21
MQDKPKRQKSYNGSTVVVQNDNVEKAVRTFKKKIMESGKLQELRDREFFEKPCVTRREKHKTAAYRYSKKVESTQLPKKLY